MPHTERILPAYVISCGWCQGKGEYEQTYTADCGGGYYRAVGRCDSCHGLGYRMKNETKVPASIINQINLLNKESQRVPY